MNKGFGTVLFSFFPDSEDFTEFIFLQETDFSHPQKQTLANSQLLVKHPCGKSCQRTVNGLSLWVLGE